MYPKNHKEWIDKINEDLDELTDNQHDKIYRGSRGSRDNFYDEIEMDEGDKLYTFSTKKNAKYSYEDIAYVVITPEGKQYWWIDEMEYNRYSDFIEELSRELYNGPEGDEDLGFEDEEYSRETLDAFANYPQDSFDDIDESVFNKATQNIWEITFDSEDEANEEYYLFANEGGWDSVFEMTIKDNKIYVIDSKQASKIVNEWFGDKAKLVRLNLDEYNDIFSLDESVSSPNPKNWSKTKRFATRADLVNKAKRLNALKLETYDDYLDLKEDRWISMIGFAMDINGNKIATLWADDDWNYFYSVDRYTQQMT